MDVLEAIEERRSIKTFDPNHRMLDKEIEKLISLAMLSPTAFNLQHWRFVVVTDPELRQEIRQHAWDQAKVTDSSLLIVLCADLKAWQKNPERYWSNLPDYYPKDEITADLNAYYGGKETVERDEAFRSCGIAAQTIMLAAKGMGYDTCPMDGFDFDKVAKTINLPHDHAISMMIAVGKATKPPHVRGGQLPISEVMIKDKF